MPERRAAAAASTRCVNEAAAGGTSVGGGGGAATPDASSLPVVAPPDDDSTAEARTPRSAIPARVVPRRRLLQRTSRPEIEKLLAKVPADCEVPPSARPVRATPLERGVLDAAGVNPAATGIERDNAKLSAIFFYLSVMSPPQSDKMLRPRRCESPDGHLRVESGGKEQRDNEVSLTRQSVPDDSRARAPRLTGHDRGPRVQGGSRD